MKKILILFAFIFGSSSAFASCETGFACSVSELNMRQILLEEQFVNDMNDYFNKNINEELFFNYKNPNLSYNDLFIFNTIV